MERAPERRNPGVRAEALAWLADELEWERRLDTLRRPARRPQTPTRRPAPGVFLARAS